MTILRPILKTILSDNESFLLMNKNLVREYPGSISKKINEKI